MKYRQLEDYPEILTLEEVSKVLRLGRSSTYEAARRGEIPTVRIGRRILVPRNALRNLLSPREKAL